MEELQALLSGNDRHAARVGESVGDLHAGQQPDTLTVCCGDSRVLQDDMWNNREPGQIFTHSNIGNRVSHRHGGGRVVSGDVLYPLVHTGTETAIVVGHTGCGAVTATYHHLTDGSEESPGITYCIDMLAEDLEPGLDRLPEDLDDETVVNRLVEYNVDRQVAHLVEDEDVPDAVDVVGMVYDIHGVYSDTSGRVQITNMDGTRDTDRLQRAYPDLADHICRTWEY